jgi:D-tyrosyl-tRNA(Tyr) deacylase
VKAVVQRVRRASVSVGGEVIAEIGPGMLVLLGVAAGDTHVQADRIAAKLTRLRIFDDADGRMNEPLGEREVLCVSQFTLLGDTSRGNRPSWTGAAPGEEAEPLYERVCDALGAKRGAFGEHMVVELENDGPVTLILES